MPMIYCLPSATRTCDAGFLVGLAVGVQLGPDALKTGGER